LDEKMKSFENTMNTRERKIFWRDHIVSVEGIELASNWLIGQINRLEIRGEYIERATLRQS
jgi:hypothetical protein